MACVSRSVISVAANTCSSSSFSFKNHSLSRKTGRIDASKFKIRASTEEAEDCNVEECAPDKEVGKVSVEWLAGEKTRVVGTFPPRKKGWTGYIEKDTAGQTNIYSVEPTVYVAESAISSGTAGTSSDGAENTSAIAAFVALISVAAAASILLQVGKAPPQMQTTVYSGPSLSYYLNKFKPSESIQISEPSQSESPSATEASQSDSSSATEASQSESSSATDSSLSESESQNSTPEVPQVPVDSGTELEPSASNAENVS